MGKRQPNFRQRAISTRFNRRWAAGVIDIAGLPSPVLVTWLPPMKSVILWRRKRRKVIFLFLSQGPSFPKYLPKKFPSIFLRYFENSAAFLSRS